MRELPGEMSWDGGSQPGTRDGLLMLRTGTQQQNRVEVYTHVHCIRSHMLSNRLLHACNYLHTHAHLQMTRAVRPQGM